MASVFILVTLLIQILTEINENFILALFSSLKIMIFVVKRSESLTPYFLYMYLNTYHSLYGSVDRKMVILQRKRKFPSFKD